MMLKHKRFDVRVKRLAGYRIEVYWRADRLGVGPCMSLYVGNRERLRFDLFSPAHMHTSYITGAPRIYYPDGRSLSEYVDLAVGDLVKSYPPAERAAGWAAEQLMLVQGPASPPIERPKVLPFARRAVARSGR